MVTVSGLREQAIELDNQIEELRTDMVQFLRAYTNARMINVMLWYDGSFKIMSTHPVDDNTLKLFLKNFGLKEKGHFSKNETQYHAIYEFIHWDPERESPY